MWIIFFFFFFFFFFNTELVRTDSAFVEFVYRNSLPAFNDTCLFELRHLFTTATLNNTSYFPYFIFLRCRKTHILDLKNQLHL